MLNSFEDDDVLLVEDQIIPIMTKFISDKKNLLIVNNVIIESWLTSLLKLSLLSNNRYFNINSYVQVIIDDPEKCNFFTKHRSRKEILKFLDTLII